MREMAGEARARRDPVRWMDYSRRSMQRLGFIKSVVGLASASGATTLQGLTGRFQAAITRLEEPPESIRPRLLDYVNEQRRALKQVIERDPLKMQIQDLYLSDPALPSRSGAITGEPHKDYRHAVYVEMPPWAVGLGLLRSRNYTQTDRGRLVTLLDPNLSQKLQSFQPNDNPFLLNDKERLFFLYCLLEADGDILAHTYDSQKFAPAQSVTRTEIGRRVTDALSELPRTKWRAAGRELLARAASVARAAERSTGSGMGPLESLGTPRTEPLVDCGVIARTDKAVYEYNLTEFGRRLTADLSAARSISEFIESRLVHSYRNIDATPQADPGVIWACVLPAYRGLRTGLGYVSVRELALLAVVQQLDESQAPAFELGEAIRTIQQGPQQWGRNVRLAQSRTRGGGQVRIDLSALEGGADG